MDIHQSNQIREVLERIIDNAREEDPEGYSYYCDDLIDEAMERINKILKYDILINSF